VDDARVAELQLANGHALGDESGHGLATMQFYARAETINKGDRHQDRETRLPDQAGRTIWSGVAP